jgi:ribosome-associated translation inhibitor RaiA
MKHNFEFRNFAADQKLQRLIDERIRKLAKKAERFPPNEIFLRAVIEENPIRKLYRVSMTLEVPKKTLATREERHNLAESIRDAFAEIDRRLEAYKATLSKEYAWKRHARREKLRKLKLS